jgi:hypothetical protein
MSAQSAINIVIQTTLLGSNSLKSLMSGTVKAYQDIVPQGIVLPAIMHTCLASAPFAGSSFTDSGSYTYLIAIIGEDGSSGKLSSIADEIKSLLRGVLFSSNGYRIRFVLEDEKSDTAKEDKVYCSKSLTFTVWVGGS